MFYVDNPEKNKNKILRQLSGIVNESDLVEIEKFSKRLKTICAEGCKLKVQCYKKLNVDNYQSKKF